MQSDAPRPALSRLLDGRPLGRGARGCERRRLGARRPARVASSSHAALARRAQIEMLKNRHEAVEHRARRSSSAERVGDASRRSNSRINSFTAGRDARRPTRRRRGACHRRRLAGGRGAEETVSCDRQLHVVGERILACLGDRATVAQARERATDVPPPEVLGPDLELSTAMILLWSRRDAGRGRPGPRRGPGARCDEVPRTGSPGWHSSPAWRSGAANLRAAELWLDELRPRGDRERRAAAHHSDGVRALPGPPCRARWRCCAPGVTRSSNRSSGPMAERRPHPPVPSRRWETTSCSRAWLISWATTSPSSSIGNSLRVTPGRQALADGNPEPPSPSSRPR